MVNAIASFRFSRNRNSAPRLSSYTDIELVRKIWTCRRYGLWISVGSLVDLSGTATFFGLTPLIYSVTGYLGGNLAGSYSKINPFYFSITWITILAFQFLIFCGVQYQDLWFINWHLFFGKWLGTTLYTLSFAGILQFIYPLHRVA